MFLSLVIDRIKYYLRSKYSKNNKNLKNKLFFFNLINLSNILLITNNNNDIMRQLLKIIDNLARLIAVIDIGKQICEHLASKKQPTIQKRNATD